MRRWLMIVGNLAFGTVLLTGHQAQAEGILIVPVITIYPGEKIQINMLREARFVDVYIARGGKVRGKAEVIGKVANRTLVAGRPIERRFLRQAYTVKVGQVVTLRYKLGGLSIVTKAMSLKSATVGQVIQTRNIDTGLQVIGTVRADGSVEVLTK